MKGKNNLSKKILLSLARQLRRPVRVAQPSPGIKFRRRHSLNFSALFIAGAVTICNTSTALAQSTACEPYSISYQAGVTCPNAGGTELMCLASHNGKLYAGIGYWKDSTGSYPGSQILVLDGPQSTWRVDHTFSVKISGLKLPKFGRVSALQEITLHYDAKGHALAAPASFLIAANDDCNTKQKERLEIFTLDDAKGTWDRMFLGLPPGLGIRSFGQYHDPVSGADYVFAGTYSNGFVRGVYAPDLPGKIRWDNVSEGANPAVINSRVMSFAQTDQGFYGSAKPYIYKYEPNGQYFWNQSAEYLDDGCSDTSGVRGLTQVPGGKLIGVLEARGSESKVLDFFPRSEELNICEFLKRKLGTDFLLPSPGTAAATGPGTAIHGSYNDTPAVTDPITRETRWLVGLGFSELRQCKIPGKGQSSWFMSRNAAGVWNLHEVPFLPPSPALQAAGFLDPQHCPPAIRCMAVSPFPADGGQAMYIGFIDALKHECHNTARIYRVGLGTALRPYSGPKL